MKASLFIQIFYYPDNVECTRNVWLCPIRVTIPIRRWKQNTDQSPKKNINDKPVTSVDVDFLSKDYRQFSLFHRYEQLTSATLLSESFTVRHSILKWWPLSSPPLLLDRWPQGVSRIVSLAGRTSPAVSSQAYKFSSNTSNLL